MIAQSPVATTRRFVAVRIIGAVFLLLVVGLIFLFSSKWPFTPERISRSLSGSTGSRVAFHNPSLFFFPSPGLALQDVELRRGPQGAPPLATARRVRLTGSWLNVLTFQHRLDKLEADGVVVKLPSDIPPRDPSAPNGAQKTTVGLLIADGAVIDPGDDVLLTFKRLRLGNVGAGHAIEFDAVVNNTNPRSRITAKGSFGPWNGADKGNTPVSGTFVVDGADLGTYNSLAGIVNAKGTVEGTLGRMQVKGEADAKDFEVNHNGHRLPVHTVYSAVVDGTDGDTTLESVNARVLGTDLAAHGSVRTSEGHSGKTVTLDFNSDRARIQDLLLLATRAPEPALSGPMTLRAHVVVPPEPEGFLKKVRLDGSFRIDLAKFNKPSTQEKLDQLSSRARDDDRQVRVRSELIGDVDLRDGVAKIHDARFAVPGATAVGGGTYNVISKVVDLQGTVAMAATVSEATTGIKSFLLKPFDALFRKRRDNAGAELPVHVTGRYPNPQFQVSLFGPKRKR